MTPRSAVARRAFRAAARHAAQAVPREARRRGNRFPDAADSAARGPRGERAGIVRADAPLAARAPARRIGRVPHHRAAAPRRRARRERAAAVVRRADRAPRGAAHDVRRGRGRRAADGARADALPVALHRSRGRERRVARAARGRHRRARRGRAVRSRARPARARAPDPARCGHALVRADDAPHRVGRLVGRRDARGAVVVLPVVRDGRRGVARAAAGAVRGLRALAAPLARRGRGRAPARVLARDARREP
ncbi:hypothetical protein NCM_04126 [Burkholderia pseudomallei]